MPRRTGSAADAFSMQHLRHAFRVLNDAIDQGQLPGAVLVLIGAGEVVLLRAFGNAELGPNARPMKYDTIFDLASLTKVVATTTAVMMLVERGRVQLDDSIGLFVPVESEAADQVNVWHLLTHTSGLPAWRDLYSHGWSPKEMVREALRTPLESRPGARVIYSDLGFMWLRELVERVTEEPFDAFVRREVFDPLAMRDTGFCPAPGQRERAAATEVDRNSSSYLCGVVHDENARALGGISGHAGLFSTGTDLGRFVAQLMYPEKSPLAAPLSAGTVALMTRNHTAQLGEWRGLGWSVKKPIGGSAGDLLSEQSFGHTGFTGTSIWVDPVRGMGVILLTNAVHLGRDVAAKTLSRLRPLVHNAVANAFLRGQ